MVFHSILGQNQALGQLKKDISSKQISHAYLFYGPDGIGKRTMAKSFAKAIICPRGGDDCLICQRIEKQIHPDFVAYEPEGNFLTIDQIREIIQLVGIKPLESPYRVVVINEAEAMTQPAANALLKSLEEPPSFTIFILITSNIEALLPTIVSRLRLIKFNTISRQQISEILTQKFSLKEAKAEQISRLSGGILGRAVDLTTKPWQLELREFILNFITSGKENSDICRFVEQLLALCREPAYSRESQNKQLIAESQNFAVNQAHLSHLKKALTLKAKRETSRLNLKAYEEALCYLADWYRDLIVFCESGSEDLLVNLDYFDEIRKSCQNIDVLQVQQFIEQIQLTQKLLRLNVNVQLALENLFLTLDGERK